MTIRTVSVSALMILSLTLGCAADRPLRVIVPPELERPRPAAMLFLVDGFGRDVFHRALAEGHLPHIEKHLIRRGVKVEHAVAAIPTITYSNAVTLITGLFPGHHGVISNRWFDPSEFVARDYISIATYQLVDNDYTAPTIHDLLYREDTYSFQAAQRRGVTDTIDNWMTSGINWFFGNYTGVDCLVAQNLELVAQRAPNRGRWPAFILAYFPGVDHIGHKYGPHTPQYLRAIQNLDQQIGRICDGLIQADVYDSTYLMLVSDHGVISVLRHQLLNVTQWLESRLGPRRVVRVLPNWNERRAREAEVVVATVGSRWCALYVRGTDEWGPPYYTNGPTEDDATPWLSTQFLEHPAVELAAGRRGEDSVWFHTRRGTGWIERRVTNATTEYRYHPEPADALGYLDDPALASFVEAGWHPSRSWLERTVTSPYPDLVPQLVEMFDSPRSGDIVLFASAGWDFAREDPRGGHGSILPGEMLVPMVIAGPDLPVGAVIPYARNTDVMPTLLDLLGAHDRISNPEQLDGVSLLPHLRQHQGTPPL
jgi:hypothetical protein